jgi:Cro/C1-type HTH DNA-binding domain
MSTTKLPHVRLTLGAFLKRHRISAYRVIRASGLAPGTVYALANGQTRGFDFRTMQNVIDVLSQMTGKAVTPNDLFEVIRDA